MRQTENKNQTLERSAGAFSRQRGFSLIELMVVLGIVGIMASIAVPSFTRMIRAQNVTTAANALISSINLARNEALSRGTSVMICSTADPNASTPACSGSYNWENGWLIFVGDDASEVSSTTLIRVGAASENIRMDATAAAQIYSSRGIPAGNGTVEVNAVPCTAGKDKQILITLSITGHIKTELAVPASGDCP